MPGLRRPAQMERSDVCRLSTAPVHMIFALCSHDLVVLFILIHDVS
jgi:hypothetical protein